MFFPPQSINPVSTAATPNTVALRDSSGDITAVKYHGDGSELTGITGGAGNPGGTTSQLQYNNDGAFAGDTATTDGAGNLTVTSITGDGSLLTDLPSQAGGADTQLQYNNAGVFAGATIVTDGTDIEISGGDIYLGNSAGFNFEAVSSANGGGGNIFMESGSIYMNNGGSLSGGDIHMDGGGIYMNAGVIQGQTITLGHPGVLPFSVTLTHASTITADWIFAFPSNGGTNGYVLSTDGTGVTSWVNSNPFNQSLNTTDSPTFTAVTATTFTGNGSALTNITPQNVAGAGYVAVNQGGTGVGTYADLFTALGLNSAATHPASDFITSSGGFLINTNNLSDVADVSTARTNLGLGSAATSDTTAFDAAGTAAAAVAALSAAPPVFDFAGTAATLIAALGTASTHAASDFVTGAAGSTGQVQWNSGGDFAGATITTDGTNLNMAGGTIVFSGTMDIVPDPSSGGASIGPILIKPNGEVRNGTYFGDGSNLTGIATTSAINTAIAAAASNYDAAGAAAAAQAASDPAGTAAAAAAAAQAAAVADATNSAGGGSAFYTQILAAAATAGNAAYDATGSAAAAQAAAIAASDPAGSAAAVTPTSLGLGGGISTTLNWLDGDGTTSHSLTIVNGVITAAS